MARKTTSEKIENLNAQIEQLENERKRLLQVEKEREKRERTSRLCERGGYIEKALPDTVTLTKEQFRGFINATLLTPFSRRELEKLTAQNATSVTTEQRGADAPNADTAATQAAKPNQQSGEAANAKPSEAIRQGGLTRPAGGDFSPIGEKLKPKPAKRGDAYSHFSL